MGNFFLVSLLASASVAKGIGNSFKIPAYQVSMSAAGIWQPTGLRDLDNTLEVASCRKQWLTI